jgi:P27 family predicted phage terminase small subunit
MPPRPPGPRPIPTYLKVLRGNPGKQALNHNEPRPPIPAHVPPPPKGLTGYAEEEWTRISTELWNLKLLTAIDIRPLAAYCQAYKIWRMATEMLTAAEGGPYQGLLVHRSGRGGGEPVRNPYLAVATQAASDMVKFASEFGMSPATRARISLRAYGDTPVVSKFDGLVEG